MPPIAPDRLARLAEALLRAAAVPIAPAACVARSLVDSNLRGLDSHGLLRLPTYLDSIAAGLIDPLGEPRVVSEALTTATLDGGRALGIYALEQATEVAIRKARETQVAAVGAVNQAHAGRIGQFAEQAARHGLFCLILGGGNHDVRPWVVPFGGRGPAFSTNPYALAVPAGRHGTVVVDFATSAIARGKVLAAEARGEALPSDSILDREGRPSTDPADFIDGGVLLPAAGSKGSGLAMMAELLCHALLRRPDGGVENLNWMILAVDLAAFRDPADYEAVAERYLDFVKAIPPAEGVAEVLLPGEPETRSAARRRAEGIALPDRTWQEIRRVAARLKVDVGAFVDAA